MNASNNYDSLINTFKSYIPLSAFDIHNLKSSNKAVLKIYKDSVYFGDFENDKRHGLGIMIYENGRVYEGEWENNLKNGKGFEKFSNDAKYQGDYKNGRPHGNGLYVWKNGQTYQGQWKDGCKHGRGLWKGSQGDYYNGEWKCGKADGEGTHVWLSGDKYSGEWKECLKHGYGRQQFANGDVYLGNYLKGKPSGYGEYYWKNGSRFKGNFKEGHRHGKGVWTKIDEYSDRYQGMYANDKKCGYGVFTWANGNMYKGSYFDDERQGYGQMYWKNKCFYKGEWQKGVQKRENKQVIMEQQTVSDGFQQQIEQLCTKTYFDQKKTKNTNKKGFNKTTENFKNLTKDDVTNTSKLSNLLLYKYDELKSKDSEPKQVKKRKLKTQTSSDWFQPKTRTRTALYSSFGNTKKLRQTSNLSQMINTFNKPKRNKTTSSKAEIKQNEFMFDLTKSLQNHVHCQQMQNFQERQKTKIPHSSFYLHRIATEMRGKSFCESNHLDRLNQQKTNPEVKPQTDFRKTKKPFKRGFIMDQSQNTNSEKQHHFRQYSFSMKH